LLPIGLTSRLAINLQPRFLLSWHSMLVVGSSLQAGVLAPVLGRGGCGVHTAALRVRGHGCITSGQAVDPQLSPCASERDGLLATSAGLAKCTWEDFGGCFGTGLRLEQVGVVAPGSGVVAPGWG
jgi:hypothetical protein